jgi:hypothetical protein
MDGAPGAVVSHPSRKDKYAARMGHPGVGQTIESERNGGGIFGARLRRGGVGQLGGKE